MNKLWTPEGIRFIRDNCEKMTDSAGAAQLSQLIGRTITTASFRKQRQLLNLKKHAGRGICKLLAGSSSTSGVDSNIGKLPTTPVCEPESTISDILPAYHLTTESGAF